MSWQKASACFITCMAALLQENLVDPSTIETQPMFTDAHVEDPPVHGDEGAEASDEEVETRTATGQKRKVVKGTFQASDFFNTLAT